MTFHVPGLGIRLSSLGTALCQQWIQLWQPARLRAQSVPLIKGNPPPFSFKGCDPEQCRIKERENLLEVPPSHCINRQCGTTGSMIFQTLLQDNEGAKVASTTRAIQCTTWQLISQGRLINWPRCSENKEDILVAGKGQTLSPRGIQ